MAISVNDALSRISKLEYEIEKVVKSIGDYAENVTVDPDNPEEFLLYSSVYTMNDKLDDVLRTLKYLKKPIRATGRLYKNDLGRYEIEPNNYFTSGSPIEVLVKKEDHDEWVASTVEHSSDYYIVALGRDVSIDGLYCRVR